MDKKIPLKAWLKLYGLLAMLYILLVIKDIKQAIKKAK